MEIGSRKFIGILFFKSHSPSTGRRRGWIIKARKSVRLSAVLLFLFFRPRLGIWFWFIHWLLVIMPLRCCAMGDICCAQQKMDGLWDLSTTAFGGFAGVIECRRVCQSFKWHWCQISTTAAWVLVYRVTTYLRPISIPVPFHPLKIVILLTAVCGKPPSRLTYFDNRLGWGSSTGELT